MSEFPRSGTVADVSELSANQVKALNALMMTTSIENAAKQCGLSVSTIKKYLIQGEFKRAYRQQRALILGETVAGITNLGTKAIGVIEGALDNAEDSNVQLRAARHALDHIAKLTELERKIVENEELEERLAALEAERDAQLWRTNGKLNATGGFYR
jgi:hypothetical protein